METMNLLTIDNDFKVKRLRENAIIPTRGSEDSAGLDLYAAIDSTVAILPGESALIGTGVAFSIPRGIFGGIFARSGLATKENLRPANCVGVCDSDYRGEYKVPIYNDSKEIRFITPNERIAQLIFLPFIFADLTEVDSLDETSRGAGGFGSTGVL